jgi:hypothetical protein
MEKLGGMLSKHCWKPELYIPEYDPDPSRQTITLTGLFFRNDIPDLSNLNNYGYGHNTETKRKKNKMRATLHGNGYKS